MWVSPAVKADAALVAQARNLTLADGGASRLLWTMSLNDIIGEAKRLRVALCLKEDT